jgi:arylsulfatase
MNATMISRRTAALCLQTTLAIAIAGCAVDPPRPAAVSPARKPNILLIVADDLGYSDIGAYGGEIPTPNLDALAGQGRLLTNFHVAAVCSPTRASLLTGTHHHLAGVGNMAEVVGSRIVSNQSIDAPWGESNGRGFDNVPQGYRGHLGAQALSMPQLLRDAGYRTYMAGKWHLAYDVAPPDPPRRPIGFRLKPEAMPNAMGFDRSFALMGGGGAHFAPATPPTPMDMEMYAEDDRLVPAARLPKDFHSTRDFTDRLIGYIDEGRKAGQPFFAYAAYTAPHWPLQAPDADIAAQRGRYDEGYEVIRHRRIERMKRQGVIPASMLPHPGVAGPAEGGTGPKRWHELSAEERTRESRLMEVYAAMVANLDAHIGRLVQHLRHIGEYDNTLILFMSDNGAEGAEAYIMPRPGTRIDNSLANLGRPGSLAAYGARWAEVGSAPFRYYKGFTGAEGGTIAPLIVKLPGQIRSRPASAQRLHVTDVLPTLLDAAGIPDPGQRWRDRPVHAIAGRSFHRQLESAGQLNLPGAEERVFVDELMGAGYVVKGRWKLARQPAPSSALIRRSQVPWSLFDLETDRGETRDLAAARPDIVGQLSQEWQRFISQAGVIEHEHVYSGR